MDEYKISQPTDNQNQQISALGLISTQVITPGNTTTAYAGYTDAVDDKKPNVVRVAVKGGNAFLKIGTDPTSTENDAYFPENHVEYLKIKAGHKISIAGDCESVYITLVE